MEFVNWLKSKDFEYKTNTEKALEKLAEASEKEGYDKHMAAELDAIKKAYQTEVKDDLKAHRQEIKQLLEEEIASRYYYDEGRIANALATDPDVLKAQELIMNKVEYTNILTVAKN